MYKEHKIPNEIEIKSIERASSFLVSLEDEIKRPLDSFRLQFQL